MIYDRLACWNLFPSISLIGEPVRKATSGLALGAPWHRSSQVFTIIWHLLYAYFRPCRNADIFCMYTTLHTHTCTQLWHVSSERGRLRLTTVSSSLLLLCIPGKDSGVGSRCNGFENQSIIFLPRRRGLWYYTASFYLWIATNSCEI